MSGGTGATNISASSLVKVPRGLVRWIDDFAGLVVGFDPGDAALLGFGELFGADDAGVEGRAAGVELEEAFDRVGEVGGLDRGAVGVFEALAQEERVGLAAVADLRQLFGQAGDDFAALLAARRARRSAAGCRCSTSPSSLRRCRRAPGPGSRGRGVGGFQRAALSSPLRRRCPLPPHAASPSADTAASARSPRKACKASSTS